MSRAGSTCRTRRSDEDGELAVGDGEVELRKTLPGRSRRERPGPPGVPTIARTASSATHVAASRWPNRTPAYNERGMQRKLEGIVPEVRRDQVHRNTSRREERTEGDHQSELRPPFSTRGPTGPGSLRPQGTGPASRRARPAIRRATCQPDLTRSAPPPRAREGRLDHAHRRADGGAREAGRSAGTRRWSALARKTSRP